MKTAKELLTLEDYQHAARDNYIEAALWSSTDDDGEPLDGAAHYDRELDRESLAAMHAECDQFIAAYWAPIIESGQTPERCGHDFWLTRNGHGVGFWDRGYPKAISDALTQAAEAEGTRDLYIGDDGKIYQA